MCVSVCELVLVHAHILCCERIDETEMRRHFSMTEWERKHIFHGVFARERVTLYERNTHTFIEYISVQRNIGGLTSDLFSFKFISRSDNHQCDNLYVPFLFLLYLMIFTLNDHISHTYTHKAHNQNQAITDIFNHVFCVYIDTHPCCYCAASRMQVHCCCFSLIICVTCISVLCSNHRKSHWFVIMKHVFAIVSVYLQYYPVEYCLLRKDRNYWNHDWTHYRLIDQNGYWINYCRIPMN